MNEPKISLIIVSYNVREFLRKNLEAFLKINCVYPFEIIIVDNGSKDGSAKMIREEFPSVHLVQNDWNSGFAHATNQGLRLAKGEVVILFNPDMLIKDGVLEKIFEILTTRPEIGVASVKLLTESGQVVSSIRRDPGFKDQLAILLKLPHWFKLAAVERYLAKDFNYEQSGEVEQVRGSFFAFRRELLNKVDYFDEKNFFLWFEEVDFCKRVRQAGFKVWHEASVSCVDLVGRSFAQVPTGKKQAIFFKSMARYFFKWQPWWQGAIIYVLRFPIVALAYLVEFFL